MTPKDPSGMGRALRVVTSIVVEGRTHYICEIRSGNFTGEFLEFAQDSVTGATGTYIQGPSLERMRERQEAWLKSIGLKGRR